MGRRPHDYRTCRDRNCERFPCRVYQEGFEDGFEKGFAEGFAEGYGEGYADGASSASKG